MSVISSPFLRSLPHVIPPRMLSVIRDQGPCDLWGMSSTRDCGSLRPGARASHDLASLTPLPVGGWRQCWLTKPAPEDPEPGERSNAMTGACLTVSQVQSIPWSAAPSFTALLLVTSAFVTPIVTRGNAAKPCTIRAAAVVEVPVSFQRKRRAQVGAGFGQADRLLQGSEVRSIWRTSAICVRASITWVVTGRAAEC